MSFFTGHAFAAGLLAVLWLGVILYLWAALPRLLPRPSLAATGILCCLGLLTVWLLMNNGDRSMALAVGLALTALVSGHGGWWWAERHADRRQAAFGKSPPGSQATVPAFVATPAATLAVAPAATAQRSSLGRYRLQRELGRGAMGAVYLGQDPQIGRQVAIKTMALGQEFDGPELVEARVRFFREAETAGRLTHPDIVTIFDAGEDQELAYIAMEYLSGHDLQRNTVAGSLLPVAQVLHIVERVAQALDHAHRQGVVHRDIKPANVMVDPATGSVKVTDFGIARITDSSRTRTGMVLGSPAYMSPEQMAGQRVDGRADLYSLGVMLFQLLTGRLPHQADSMARLMFNIANEPAPDVRSLRPELPGELAQVVAHWLAKKPEQRPADAYAAAAELKAAALVCQSLPLPAPGDAAQAAAPSVHSDAFAATVKVSRSDPRHNSTP